MTMERLSRNERGLIRTALRLYLIKTERQVAALVAKFGIDARIEDKLERARMLKRLMDVFEDGGR